VSAPAKTARRIAIVPGQTPIQRAAEVTRMNRYMAPARIVIDPSLPPGSWYVVRGLTPTERAVVDRVTDAATTR